MRMGILASLTANIHRGKGGKAYKATDFMPYYDDPAHAVIEPQTPEEEARAVAALFAGLGVEIVEKNDGKDRVQDHRRARDRAASS